MLLVRDILHVRISADRCDAWATVDADSDGQFLTPDEVKARLARAGVVFGVDERAVAALCKTPVPPEPVLVARGIPPARGRDGWIEYRFDVPESEAKGESEGRIDLRECSAIRNVLAGQVLALLHPPEPGVPGTSVSGETLPAPRGNPAKLRAGTHTEFSPEDPASLVARVDGHAERRPDGTIHVAPVVTVAGNVDYSTGNIDFVGSLVVRGDVAGGFSVRARGSVRVDGTVGDAEVRAGTSARIAGGFVGHGHGVLEAGGDVFVSHLVNQKVVAGGSVTIEKESVNGTITADGSIVGPTAVVAGGILDAMVEVKVWSLGSSEESHCKVRVGSRSRTVQRLGELGKEIKQTRHQEEDVARGLEQLAHIRIDRGHLSEQLGEVLARLRELQKTLPVCRAALENERDALLRKLREPSEARVVVLDTVHENVMLNINGARTFVTNAVREVKFVEYKGSIEAHPL